MKILWPVKNRHIGNDYGARESFRLPNGQWTLPFHYGIDFAQPAGTPIYAAHDGTIIYNQYDDTPYGGGNMIGIENGEWSTWYLHRYALTNHRVGQAVKAGEIVGHIGSTGASTGPHLHFELQYRREPVDPKPYFVTTFDVTDPPRTWEEEEDDMKPTIHFRTEGTQEWTRCHPDIGKTLKPGTSRKDGNVMIYRGFEATSNKTVGIAWARQYANGAGYEHSRTDRAGYIAIQKQATRLSVEVHG